MDFHPARCLTDAACIASVVGTVSGWLPTFLASAAALLACAWYAIAIYDRIKKGRLPHE